MGPFSYNYYEQGNMAGYEAARMAESAIGESLSSLSPHHSTYGQEDSSSSYSFKHRREHSTESEPEVESHSQERGEGQTYLRNENLEEVSPWDIVQFLEQVKDAKKDHPSSEVAYAFLQQEFEGHRETVASCLKEIRKDCERFGNDPEKFHRRVNEDIAIGFHRTIIAHDFPLEHHMMKLLCLGDRRLAKFFLKTGGAGGEDFCHTIEEECKRNRRSNVPYKREEEMMPRAF